MPGRLERHARSKWDWGTGHSRSAQRLEAVTEPDRKAPGRKDRKTRCKQNGGGPHVPAVAFIAPGLSAGDCRWVPCWSWRERRFDSTAWSCFHEEQCSLCGKVLRASVTLGECPAYPGDPAQRAAAEADAVRAQERQDAWRGRRKVITGPQGYRRRREKASP